MVLISGKIGAFMKTKRDFAIFVGLLLRSLRNASFHQSLRLKAKPLEWETDTDGCCFLLGRFAKHNYSLVLFWDRFTLHDQRKLYYGLFSNKRNDILKLARLSHHDLGRPIRVTRRDIDDGTRAFQLREKLSRIKFGQPVLEIYSQKGKLGDHYYGIYEFDHAGIFSTNSKKLADRVMHFVATILAVLPGGNSMIDRSTIYPKIENRQMVARHLRRERSTYLATRRKQLDNYICAICKFKFESMYGALGRDFAECHHIVPLSADHKKRVTIIGDLITVCSNCHRMLHKMAGVKADIRMLQDIIRNSIMRKSIQGE